MKQRPRPQQGPAKPPKPLPHTLYSDAAENVFRVALEKLLSSLPEHHDELVALLETGKLHEPDSLLAILDGSVR